LCDLSKAGAEQSRGVNWEEDFASLNGRAQQLYEDVLYEETSVKRYFIAKPLFLFSQPT
jgi:hypothetical protein